MLLISHLFFLFSSPSTSPPLFDGQDETKVAEANSNNKHEKLEEKQKEENNTANRVNEVSFIFDLCGKWFESLIEL